MAVPAGLGAAEQAGPAVSVKAGAKGNSAKHTGTRKHHATRKHHQVHHRAAAKAHGAKAHHVARHPHHPKPRGFAVGDFLPACALEAVAMSLRLAGQPVTDDEVAWLWELSGGREMAIVEALAAAARFGLGGCRSVSPCALVCLHEFAEPPRFDDLPHEAVVAQQFLKFFGGAGDIGDMRGDLLATLAPASRQSPRGGLAERGAQAACEERHDDWPVHDLDATARFGLVKRRLLAAEPVLNRRVREFLPGVERGGFELAESSTLIVGEVHALILGIDVPGPHCVLATPDGWWSWGELHSPWPARIEEAWAVSWT